MVICVTTPGVTEKLWVIPGKTEKRDPVVGTSEAIKIDMVAML